MELVVPVIRFCSRGTLTVSVYGTLVVTCHCATLIFFGQLFVPEVHWCPCDTFVVPVFTFVVPAVRLLSM